MVRIKNIRIKKTRHLYIFYGIIIMCIYAFEYGLYLIINCLWCIKGTEFQIAHLKSFRVLKRVRSDVSEKTYEYLINTCHDI